MIAYTHLPVEVLGDNSGTSPSKRNRFEMPDSGNGGVHDRVRRTVRIRILVWHGWSGRHGRSSSGSQSWGIRIGLGPHHSPRV